MLDIFIIAVLLISAALGFKDGFFRKIYGLLGFLGGICAALILYEWLGGLVGNWLEFSLPIARIFAFATIFVIFVVILNVVYRWTGGENAKTITVKSRLTGGAVGAFQGALIISLLLMVGNKIGLIEEQQQKESMMYSSFIDLTPKVMGYTMKWLPKAQEFIKELKEKI